MALFANLFDPFNEQRDKTTNDPMEATFIGFRMWAQAVTQAGTTDVNAVRQAHVRSESKGAQRFRGGDEHQSSSFQAGHDRQAQSHGKL